MDKEDDKCRQVVKMSDPLSAIIHTTKANTLQI